MKNPDLSECHLGALKDETVLSVSGGPGAQELKPVMI